MRETYRDFQQRLLSFQPDSYQWQRTGFDTHPALRQKVDEQGNLLPFYGDTILFTLDAASVQRLSRVQKQLYQTASPILSQPLSPLGFHLTLHDLSSGPSRSSLTSIMSENATRYLEICQAMQAQDFPKQIRLRSTHVFHMVNTSIAAGYEPATEKQYDILMYLYELFDKIRPLPYPLTPHITLAYYRPGYIGEKEVSTLSKTCRILSQEKSELLLDISRLYYAEFTDMDHYLLKHPAVL